MTQIRLFVGPEYKETTLFTHVDLLFPFWGVTAKESMPYVRSAALQYQYSKEHFALVDRIQDADYVLLPYQYDRFMRVNPRKVRTIMHEAQQAGKPIIIDGAGDIERAIDVPNSVVFRVSQYTYRKQPHEITVPFLAEDLQETYVGKTFVPRKKTDVPSVGFTGWAALDPLAQAKLVLKEMPITLASLVEPRRGAEHKGVFFRQKALVALGATAGIETHFKARPSYSGHVATITGSVEGNRREFVENLQESDYALCVRGDANASVRFYEALSLGRIPLFLDTECVLPLEDKISYRDFCVFVDWKDTDKIGEQLLSFHKSITPERFEEMQYKARAAYQDFLRMDAFSGHLADMLKQRIIKP